MEFNFDINKSIQAGQYLLRLNNGSMEYLRFNKLLYIAELESLLNTNYPITGSGYIMTEIGIALKDIWNLTNLEGFNQSIWSDCIHKNGSTLECIKDSNYGELCGEEEYYIEKSLRLYHKMSLGELISFTDTEICTNISQIIPLEQILIHLGKSPQDISWINENISNGNFLSQMFKGS
jgi:hypothetical protein